uniref:Uncharacterized protein n=1 Tax=Parascaris univalens TaxID=6257 RepID=A0A914ZGW9_PARUN
HTASKAGQWSQDETPACYQQRDAARGKNGRVASEGPAHSERNFHREQCSKTKYPSQLYFASVYAVCDMIIYSECGKFYVQNIQWIEKRSIGEIMMPLFLKNTSSG